MASRNQFMFHDWLPLEPIGSRLESAIKLNPRALDIFERLDRDRMLPTNHQHAFLGCNLTNLSNQLGDLYHEQHAPYFDHYLDRPEGAIAFAERPLCARHLPQHGCCRARLA